MPEFSRTVTVSGFALQTDQATILSRIPGVVPQEANYAYQYLGTNRVPIVLPANAAGITVASGAGAWTKGAYVQMVAASVLTGHILCAIYPDDAASQSGTYELDIATGAAASEVVIGTFPISWNTSYGLGVGFLLPIPLIIPANARVAARASSLGGAGNLVLKLGFLPKPL